VKAPPRVFVDAALSAGCTLELTDDRAHYLQRVLRLRAGDEARLFNGEGGEWTALLLAVQRRAVRVEVQEPVDALRESPLATHLGIGWSRGERMDWVVQKATELGVHAITPLVTARCNVHLEDARVDKRLRHWRQVAVSACEQCGRNRLPVLDPPRALQHWLQDCSATTRLLLAPGAAGADPVVEGSVALLVGPEGGLDGSELVAARDAGFSPWTLGPRVLRTETAPLAALAILQYRAGDFRA
jgi:16S rRNA (uracil1498-N3)-methyltransferase